MKYLYRRETISRLYKLKPDGTLTAIQNVDTKGASSVSQFQIASVNYLVVTNSMDNNGVSEVSSVSDLTLPTALCQKCF